VKSDLDSNLLDYHAPERLSFLRRGLVLALTEMSQVLDHYKECK
jgi:hypothetical protein